jgi:hypothetical protein
MWAARVKSITPLRRRAPLIIRRSARRSNLVVVITGRVAGYRTRDRPRAAIRAFKSTRRTRTRELAVGQTVDLWPVPAALEDLVSANTRARLRLRRWIDAHGSSAGRDAGAILAHLAFWDAFYAARWELRRDGDLTALRGLGVSVVNPINDAGSPLWRSVDLRAAIVTVLGAAERVDAVVAGLAADLVAEAESSGAHRMLERALHRNEHLDELERLGHE